MGDKMRLQEAAALDGVTFSDALESFRATAEGIKLAHFARQGYTFAVPTIEIAAGGRKYIKLIAGEKDPETGEARANTGVHSFVEVATGQIFKPASYKAPAKHARGNIYSDDHGAHALTDDAHVKYLR
jgi:hypothetical protein